MKRILSLLLALIMIVGTITPVMALPGETEQDEKNVTVNVHKILMSKENLQSHDKNKKYDPTKGIEKQNLANFFGDSAKEIASVYFVAIKEREKGYDDFDSKTKEEKDAIINKLDSSKKGLTTANGLALILSSPGNYKIYEVKHKSTYTGENDKLLAESKAVPVELKLPEHARTETGIADAIHVYPKNTEDGPTVDKKVKNEQGSEVKEATFDKEQEHTWVIEAEIPFGVEDYEVFKLTDTLEQALSYVSNQTVSVTIPESTVNLAANTDYTVTAPNETKGGTLTVALTKTGIEKLKGAVGKKVRVEFKTTINENAVMSKNIPNEVELEYGHDPNNTKKKKPQENPRVYTGGKKFKKIDSSQQDKALQGAEFVIKNGEGKYLFEENGKYVWKDVAATEPKTIGEEVNIKKITSGDDGTFEIKGLKYDRTAGTDYKLVEVKAPKDYALLTQEVSFKVTDTSYYSNVANLTVADPQSIDNKPITIPQTGGIGTVIFTVVGVALMAGAVIAMRKNREA